MTISEIQEQAFATVEDDVSPAKPGPDILQTRILPDFLLCFSGRWKFA